MIGAIAAAAIYVAGVTKREICALNRPDACRDANELEDTKAFRAAVRQFVGHRRADYLYSGGWLDEQFGEVFGGPPGPTTRLGSLTVFTGCRAHECEDKGAVVLAPDGKIVALGMLHSSCGLPQRSDDCFAHLTLTLFVRNSAANGRVIDHLTAWAKQIVATAYHPEALPADHLDRVEVIPH